MLRNMQLLWRARRCLRPKQMTTLHFDLMKRCFKCNQLKTLSDFYAHSQMRDGTLNKCITCAKRDAVERRRLMLQDPEWVEKERERGRLKMARMRKLGLIPPPTNVVRKAWALRNPEKVRAHRLSTYAQRKGLISKPKACQLCRNESKRLEKHHGDYTKPLDVTWLCAECHGKTRRIRRAA